VTYSEKLRDPRWQKRRLEIFQRDGFACVGCGSTRELHCHHILYSGEPWESEAKDLQTLCSTCHEELGPHPKGGVWYRGKGEKNILTDWCPKCGGIIIMEGIFRDEWGDDLRVCPSCNNEIEIWPEHEYTVTWRTQFGLAEHV
jgi:hypothetical protein